MQSFFYILFPFMNREFCILNWTDSEFSSRKVKTITGILRMDKEKGEKEPALIYTLLLSLIKNPPKSINSNDLHF